MRAPGGGVRGGGPAVLAGGGRRGHHAVCLRRRRPGAPAFAPRSRRCVLLAIERVEHRAEVELQAALGAKLPASVLLFQAHSDELTRFQADPAPTAENYPLLASLVGKRGAVDLQRAAQLVAERRARWLQRAAAVEALRLQTLGDLEAATSQKEIDAVLQRLDWNEAQRPAGRDDGRLTPNLTLRELAPNGTRVAQMTIPSPWISTDVPWHRPACGQHRRALQRPYRRVPHLARPAFRRLDRDHLE